MKYIKTYEMSETWFKVGDYILKKQYQGIDRYPNSAKIIEIIPIKSGKAYRLLFANQHTLDIHENLIDRKMTDEEIQQYHKDAERYELDKATNKYNL